jgi:hypothetical protein
MRSRAILYNYLYLLTIVLPLAYIVDSDYLLISKIIFLVIRKLKTYSSLTLGTLDSC